jgi:hypothetical protein
MRRASPWGGAIPGVGNLFQRPGFICACPFSADPKSTHTSEYAIGHDEKETRIPGQDFRRIGYLYPRFRSLRPREVAEAFMRAEDHSLSADDIRNMDYTPRGHGGSHPYLVHEFVGAVAEDRVPEINAWEAARYMAMGVMAHKSALKDGELLDVPDWGDAPESL